MMEVSPDIVGLLNLDRAWSRVWRDRLSDFASPGLEYPAVRKNPSDMLDAIRAELLTGQYRPSNLRRIDALKPNHTLRPGALPVVMDRILYQALVDVVADTSESRLLGLPTVYGFALNTDAASEENFFKYGGYDEFRARIASDFHDGHQFVLETDIAAYFECVEQRFLQEILLGLGVDGIIVDALLNLLSSWNRPYPTGLPQGCWPSDYLGARVYLDRVDKAMQLNGYRYFRYSDDIRIVGDSLVEIRKGLRDLIVELRKVGLQVQTAKTNLLEPDQVERSLARLHARIQRTKKEELANLLGISPYGYTSPEEALRELTEEEILTSEPLLDALLEEAFGNGTAPEFDLCRSCFAGYRRIRSSKALPEALQLLDKLPALTSEIIRYIQSVVQPEHAEEVKSRVLALVVSEQTIHAWQKHWLLRLLGHPHVRTALTPDEITVLFQIAKDRNEHWSVRSPAISLLGIVGTDTHCRALVSLYQDESWADVRHAIIGSLRRLPVSERKGLYRLFAGADVTTDVLLDYMTASG